MPTHAPTHGSRSTKRALSAATAALVLAAIAPAGAAADVAENKAGWSTTSAPIFNTITQAYELAIDQDARKLYVADAGGITTARETITKVPILDANGAPVVPAQYIESKVSSTAKVSSWSTVNNAFIRNVSYLPNGVTGFLAPGQTGNPRFAFPYGVAVDSKRHIVVTTNTRSNTVTFFDGAATATSIPLDATLFLNNDPSPVPYFAHPMSLGVDSSTGRAYIANNGSNSVLVFDTATKALLATIPNVTSPTKFAIDEAAGVAFVGVGAERGNTPAKVTILDLKTNTVKGELTLPTATDTNTRPGLDTDLQKVYVGSYAGKSVSVFNAKTGEFLKRIDTAGSSNTVTVDSKRHLVYSADHRANVVTVIDSTTDEVVQVVPVAPNVIAVAVDHTSGVAYASSQGTGSTAPNLGGSSPTTGFGIVTTFKVTKDAPAPTQGPAGPAGPTGPAGASGVGVSSLSISIDALKLLGSKVKYEAPGAGVLNVVVTSGGKTVATGKRTSTAKGSYSLTLTKTKTGKKKLSSKKSIKGTLTATFTPKGSTAVVSKSIKAKLSR